MVLSLVIVLVYENKVGGKHVGKGEDVYSHKLFIFYVVLVC